MGTGGHSSPGAADILMDYMYSIALNNTKAEPKGLCLYVTHVIDGQLSHTNFNYHFNSQISLHKNYKSTSQITNILYLLTQWLSKC